MNTTIQHRLPARWKRGARPPRDVGPDQLQAFLAVNAGLQAGPPALAALFVGCKPLDLLNGAVILRDHLFSKRAAGLLKTPLFTDVGQWVLQHLGVAEFAISRVVHFPTRSVDSAPLGALSFC